MSHAPPPQGVLGIGLDVIEISAFSAMRRRRGASVMARMCTASELAGCEGMGHPDWHMATRLAAKEAAFKAGGTGWDRGVDWHDAEVLCTEQGPTLRISGALRQWTEARRARAFMLSTARARGHVAAVVVMLGEP